jgi:CRP-like cAMP-binding protein
MTAHQIRRVILQGRVVDYQDGEVIMQAGDESNEMFVLLDGRVAIETKGEEFGQARISIGSIGEVFGVAALTCGRSRVATATAIGGASVVKLNWRRLQRLARFFPRSAYALFRNLATITGERLANKVTSDQTGLPVSFQSLIPQDTDTNIH